MRAESTLSTLARPPIQTHEVEHAKDAVCPQHNGLIRETGDKPGTVFWCPVGRMYWRYQPDREPGFKTRLNYGRAGI